MKKFYSISLALALASPMMAESLQIFKCTPDGIPGRTEPQLMGLTMSPDGLYIGGTIEQGAGIFIADCRTGEVKWALAEDGGGELRGIDNNGIGIGFTTGGILYSFQTEETTPLRAPEDVRSIIGEDLSDDGSIKIGSVISQSFNTEAAYAVGDEVWRYLTVPTEEEKGNLAGFMNSISAAKYVSADGSVIMGHLGSFSFPIIWTRNEGGEYIPDFYPERFVKAVEADRYDESKPLYALSGMYTCLSNNGRYAGAVGLIANDDNTATRLVPVIYDTQTKELNIYSEEQDIDPYGVGLYPRAIADDGTFIGTVDQTASEANLGCFIMRAGERQAELYIDAFPEFDSVLGESDLLGQNIPTGISADGQHILGYTFYSDDYDLTSDAPAYYTTYVISLDGSGVQEITPTNPNASNTGTPTIYSIDGRKQSRLQKGLNIIRNPDGTTTKLLK